MSKMLKLGEYYVYCPNTMSADEAQKYTRYMSGHEWAGNKPRRVRIRVNGNKVTLIYEYEYYCEEETVKRLYSDKERTDDGAYEGGARA